MLIYFQDETVEMENNAIKVSEIIETINNIIAKNKVEFSHLIIDGQPIYDDFFDFFTEHIAEIEKVEVMVVTSQKIVQDTIISTDQYIGNAIPQIKALAEEFYQQPIEATWTRLIYLFEGIEWILESGKKIDKIKGLDQIVTHYTVWNEYVQTVAELNVVIPELENAMVSKDNILLGDLLLYEVSPIFEKMQSSLKFLITQQGRDGIVS